MGSMRDEMVKVAAELEQPTADAPKVEPAKVETPIEAKKTPQEPAKTTEPIKVTEKAAAESDDPLPEGWADEKKESWKMLSPDLRKYLKEREKQRNDGLTSKMQEADKIRKQYERYAPVSSLFDPIRDQLALQGITEEQYMRNLLNAHVAINRDPRAALRQLAKQYGIDPAEFAAHVSHADPELENLKSRLAAQEQRWNMAQNQSVQAVNNQVTQTIQAFQEEKDATGILKHPHFEKVRVAMGALLSSKQANDMQDAYDRAVMVDPEIRESFFQERIKAELARQDAERAEKAKQAKAAGLNIKGSTSVNVEEDKPKTWGSALRQTARELSN